MLRFGLLGAGRIGRIHGANVADSAGARLVAVHDASHEAAKGLAEATGAEVREAGAILSAGDIDAVLVCTPTDMHAEMIEAAAAAGKAVFCEKPVDLSSDRIRRTLEKVGAAPLMIGFNRRFDPNFAALRARIGDGLVGEVELVTILSRDPSPPPVSYIERSGGLFRDMMIHDFDMARFLLGEEIVSVFAMGSALVDPAIGKAGDVDTAAVLMRTASGKICQISCSRRATYGYDQRIEVHGSKGLLKAENVPETTVVLATEAGITADPVQNFFLERYARAYREELRHFIEAIEGGTAPIPSGADGLAAGLLADAADRSWRTGEEVKPG
ncbi:MULTISPECIES: inositol 2-dehydrogenase [unclassified Aureimonas]|uniref:inositol 2-dehydrogenase n=1 Tax=unclassified Aureimonas TaxID=2615206 RepID=UPI0006FEDD06|nr:MULTISPECIES: inositol 2-dehydrogenase [unclassified Aureimonas]KQT64107.1 inositol 2-dehydrogenase [Aureimonas sp. Leaf427]KQT81296.1 inositol 2-dehydrogenase [Aureimonas sp. Leaf460]